MSFLVQFQTFVPIRYIQPGRCSMADNTISIIIIPFFRATSWYHSNMIAPITIVKEEHLVVGDSCDFADARKMGLRFIADDAWFMIHDSWCDAVENEMKIHFFYTKNI